MKKIKNFSIALIITLCFITTLGLVHTVSADPVENSTSASCVSLTTSLKYGSSDAFTNGNVSILQDFLTTGGYLTTPGTGYFSLTTKNAVMAFQRANGLTPDGSVGPITRAKLNALYGCGGSITPSINTPSSVAGCDTRTTGYNTLTGQPCGVTTGPLLVAPCTINNFSASPSTLTQGQSTNLNWSMSSGCNSHGIDSRVPGGAYNPTSFIPLSGLSGSLSVSPSQTTVYTFTATPNTGSSQSQSVTVNVNSAQTGPINTLSYFLNTQGKTLTGTHPLSQTVNGQTIYNVKWANDSYETYTYDNNYIYLKEDHSGSPNPGSYTFSDGKWMKLSMQVGDQISVSDNTIQNFTVGTNSCTPTTAGSFPYVMTLLQHNPTYDLGGSLGVQDVIVLQYDYRNGSGTDYEKSYYAKGWGFVKWELYRNNQLIQTSIFNQISTAAPTAPNLQVACINTPITPVVVTPPSTTNPNLPTLPTSLNGFVSTLYSCVLNNSNPDSSGFNFWLKDLQSGALTIQGAYTQLFGYQSSVSPAITNDQFTQKLYGCILFRAADQTSYNNVMSGLTSGNLTQANLVQTVLNSPEFINGILPKLQVLK